MVKLEMFKSLVISTADLIENVTRLNQWLFQKYKSFYLNGINNRLLDHFTSPILRRTFRCVYGNNFVDFEVFLFEHQTISNCWHRYPKPKWNWWWNAATNRTQSTRTHSWHCMSTADSTIFIQKFFNDSRSQSLRWSMSLKMQWRESLQTISTLRCGE